MQVSLADDDCTGGAKLFDEPGIFCGVWMKVAIEANAATGGRAGEVEAIFDRNGKSPECGEAVAEGAIVTARHGLNAKGFSVCPGCVLPEIGVVAGVLAGVGGGFFS